MQSPATTDAGGEAWKAYVTKRTKAMPKNSLFGTSLENVDEKEMAAVDAVSYEAERLKQRAERQKQYEPKIPEHLRNQTAKASIEAKQATLQQKEAKLSKRQRAVAEMEDHAKYFQSLPESVHTQTQVRKKMLLADPGLDFELTTKMNDVGLHPKNNYNREKYQKRPPVHQYAVIGDPLEYGMDFALNETETHEKYRGHDFARTAPVYIERRKPQPMPLDSNGVPINIRAMYGSKVIDELFSDKKAVERVKADIEQEALKRKRIYKHVDIPRIDVATPKNYGDLSRALRLDKFGDHTFHEQSLMKESHSIDVFNRRYKDPDEFRHQWDEYGKWKEKQLQREAMDKEIDALLENRPKAVANWDRNATRAPLKQEQPKPAKKPKPKSKPKETKKGGKEPLFEDVQFVTPPMTPEYRPPPPIAPITNTRDDEFWEFYEKGLPS